ncbi:Carnosine synthase 1 [Hondaea fermentalgiana]|uniref:Carnosine synthase 1 n=1 Tax=Hondaea fermentalgiana TaxID=2315210 RepID=A0A2R5GQA4_9STRA|nr:Carnosine synthase 1 [Hondaea fermentalgiana]|eukprot:GBG33056.1 Carnosine synthase 1 [Hondaea fermentalgiana]
MAAMNDEVQTRDALLAENRADEETQQARLQALNGKTVLWVCAAGVPMMSENLASKVRWVRDHGVRLVALFSSPEEKLVSVFADKGLMDAAVFAPFESNDVGALVQKALDEADIRVDGVHSPYEQGIVTAAAVANYLGLASNPKEAFVAARDKGATRERCRAAGIPMPRSGVAASQSELAKVTEHVGFPLIIKPSSGAGSCGVFRANSLEEACDAFAKIEEDLKSNWALSSHGMSNTVLVEQLLVGPEFDVDVIMADGEPRFMATSDNWECLAPYFLETGSNCPSVFPAKDVAALEEYTVDVIRALGFTQGAFHVESILTTEGPRLIECNARVGGGNVQLFHETVHNVDMFANSFLLSMGVPVNPPVSAPRCGMADFSFTCEQTGTLLDASFPERLRKTPGVFSSMSYYKAGDYVVGSDTGFPVWLGEFIVKVDTAQNAIDLVQRLVAETEIKIRRESVGSETDIHERKEDEDEINPASSASSTPDMTSDELRKELKETPECKGLEA